MPFKKNKKDYAILIISIAAIAISLFRSSLCYAGLSSAMEIYIPRIQLVSINAVNPSATKINCKVVPSYTVLDSVKFTAPGTTQTKTNVSGNFYFTFDQNELETGENQIELIGTVNDSSFSVICMATRIMKETSDASEIIIARFFCEGMGTVPFNHYLKEFYDEVNYSIPIITGSKTLFLKSSAMEAKDNISPYGQPTVSGWGEIHYYKKPEEFGMVDMNIAYLDENNRRGISMSDVWVDPSLKLLGIAETTDIILKDDGGIYPACLILNACVDKNIP